MGSRGVYEGWLDVSGAFCLCKGHGVRVRKTATYVPEAKDESRRQTALPVRIRLDQALHQGEELIWLALDLAIDLPSVQHTIAPPLPDPTQKSRRVEMTNTLHLVIDPHSAQSPGGPPPTSNPIALPTSGSQTPAHASIAHAPAPQPTASSRSRPPYLSSCRDADHETAQSHHLL